MKHSPWNVKLRTWVATTAGFGPSWEPRGCQAKHEPAVHSPWIMQASSWATRQGTWPVDHKKPRCPLLGVREATVGCHLQKKQRWVSRSYWDGWSSWPMSHEERLGPPYSERNSLGVGLITAFIAWRTGRKMETFPSVFRYSDISDITTATQSRRFDQRPPPSPFHQHLHDR